jgi:hypothetical protein
MYLSSRADVSSSQCDGCSDPGPDECSSDGVHFPMITQIRSVKAQFTKMLLFISLDLMNGHAAVRTLTG